MKRKSGYFFILLVISALLWPATLISQVPQSDTQTKRCIVYLKDGTTVQGIIINESAQELNIQTENLGTVNIKKEQVQKIVPLNNENFRKGKYWFPNPNYSRYFFGPGLQLKKGEGYYQNTDLSLNSINYGLTDFLSIGGGIEIYSTLSGHPTFFITPKVGFKIVNSLSIGGGFLYANTTEAIGDFAGLGIGYGTVTYGNENSNATLGIGWGMVDKTWSDKPIVTVSGMTRVARSIALVTENWFVPDYAIFTYGVRFIGERIAVDIGFVNTKDIIKTFPIGFPIWLDFVLKFK
jgi:hypothetical protein